jgi:hypothetical protein
MQELYGKQIQMHNSFLIYMLGLFIALPIWQEYICL